MARLPDLQRYRACPISRDDPLRFHYWPVVGRLYRRRIDGCVALIGSGRRVLDVGYGSGTTFLELAERFEEIHGLDTHDYGSSIARVFAQEGLKVTLKQGSILHAPYSHEYFDAILAMSILEHLRASDQRHVMLEIHRLLRPDGVLVVGVPGVNRLMSLGFKLLGVEIDRHHFSSPRVVLDATAQLFKIDRVVRQPPLHAEPLLTYTWLRARKA